VYAHSNGSVTASIPPATSALGNMLYSFLPIGMSIGSWMRPHQSWLTTLRAFRRLRAWFRNLRADPRVNRKCCARGHQIDARDFGQRECDGKKFNSVVLSGLSNSTQLQYRARHNLFGAHGEAAGFTAGGLFPCHQYPHLSLL
jgi:hypothetical protein